MFTVSTIRELSVSAEAPFVHALAEKLSDIDKTRIHKTDDLVLRKAIFGLLEVVAELEQRLIALEGPEAHAEWSSRLSVSLSMPTPDQVRLSNWDDQGRPGQGGPQA